MVYKEVMRFMFVICMEKLCQCGAYITHSATVRSGVL